MMLGPDDMRPSRDDFEVVGVLNPGAVATRDGVVFLLRVAERPRERRPGIVGLPRWNCGSLEVDWVAETDVAYLDPRVVLMRASGNVRLTFASHLLVAVSRDGRTIDTISDVRFVPEGEVEEFGVEDARITPLDGRYYFTYVAVSHHGAATALASTTDFATFQRHGIIFPPENKDVLLFPELIDRRYAALHRPNPATHFHPPEIWLGWSSNLRDWGGHEPLSFAPAKRGQSQFARTARRMLRTNGDCPLFA